MHTLSTRVETRMHIAAKALTPMLQSHASRRGAPVDLTSHLAVQWNGSNFTTTVDHPSFQAAYDDHEWGSLNQPPLAFARTFEPQLQQAFAHSLDHALRAHLGGER